MSENISWFAGIIEALDLESVKLERMVVQSEILRDGVIALAARAGRPGRQTCGERSGSTQVACSVGDRGGGAAMKMTPNMTPREYQWLAARTLIDAPDSEISGSDMMLVWNAIGLAGEAGEVCEHIKKGVFHQHGIDRDKMRKELGDVLWYVAALCTKLELDMGDVMAANIEKLMARYPDGYNPADSMARRDTAQEEEQPRTIHTLHLNGNELVYVRAISYNERLPHLNTLSCDEAIEALRQRYYVYVDDDTLEQIKETLAAQGINI
jgi:NTP pyrophosphatase (non-canonical NTP hydrolase)